MPLICHITTASQWEAAQTSGEYVCSSLKDEGFIHCSEKNQVSEIINRYYKNLEDVIVLNIDSDKLKSQLVFEWSPSVQATFPHVYGPINLDSIVEAIPLN